MILLNRRRISGKSVDWKELCPYETEGLIIWLDAIWNNGINKHSSTGSEWVNIPDTTLKIPTTTKFTFSESNGYYQYKCTKNHASDWYRVEFSGLSSTLNTSKAYTIEVISSISTNKQLEVYVGGIDMILGLNKRGYLTPVMQANVLRAELGSAYVYGEWGQSTFLDSDSYTTPVAYYNGNALSFVKHQNKDAGTFNDNVGFGSGWSEINTYLRVKCLRVYDRVLTETERVNNLTIDNTRYDLGLTL